jgi:hypothetical protein
VRGNSKLAASDVDGRLSTASSPVPPTSLPSSAMSTAKRSPSPDASAGSSKKAKIESESSSSSAFVPTLFDPSTVAELHEQYAGSTPYRHAVVDRLFPDELLTAVRDELAVNDGGLVGFAHKSTDIYSVRPGRRPKRRPPLAARGADLPSSESDALPSPASTRSSTSRSTSPRSRPSISRTRRLPSCQRSASSGKACTRPTFGLGSAR